MEYAVAVPLEARQDSPFQIQWGPCPVPEAPPNLDCGQLLVPVDWNDPTGEQIALVMTRVNATNPSQKIGSLLFNPGGPGEAATDVCLGQALGVQAFSEALAERFDLVCPDPRGVGYSTPITCDPELYNQNISIWPRTEEEFAQLAQRNQARYESCYNISGEIMKHVDQTSVAHDIEAIRQALNDGPLNWLGLSYGTLIGSAYAELYPENIRAMVLDGDVDHSETAAATLYIPSATYENSLDRFFDWCASNATACGFVGDDLPKMFDDLMIAANQEPIPAPGCLPDANTALAGGCEPTAAGTDMLINIQAFLTFKYSLLNGTINGWDYLGLALNQTVGSRNATLLSNRLQLTNATLTMAANAIACLDWTTPNATNTTTGFTLYNQREIMGAAFNKHVGNNSQSYHIQEFCVGWPLPPSNPPHYLNQTATQMTPTILLVNSEHDPSTSYVWALGLKEQLPNSVLVTRDGDGHTSYFLHGEAAQLMDAYFLNLDVPADGIVVQS